MATQATSLWGCSSMTWDLQYHHYVAIDDADACLGATTFQDGLSTLLNRSVILLDSFNPARQNLILHALRTTPGLSWTVVARQGIDFHDRTCRLQRLGQHAEVLLPCQTLTAPADGWSTGNLAPIHLKKND
eukprot:2602074-Rhodomonas_salina.1